MKIILTCPVCGSSEFSKNSDAGFPCKCCGTVSLPEEMTAKTMMLSCTEAMAIAKKYNSKNMTGPDFKALAKKIAEEYGIEGKDALSLIRGENILEIVAKYEAQND